MVESETKIDYTLLAPQALVYLVDSMSYMVVAPSIIFYVLGVGGTKEQYGIILSAFSFSSFAFKPVLGYWSDKSGGKFRAPYLLSIGVACLGGIFYFIASAFEGPLAVGLILAGRLLGGVGAANQTLGYTYVATVMPKKQLTKSSALLSMMRVTGMAVAPGLNVFLDKSEGFIGSFEITPLNSVGLFLIVSNAIGFFVMFVGLKEPEVKQKHTSSSGVDEKSLKFWQQVFCLDILVPVLSIFTLNANFQLLETGMAPAANDSLGWGPVGISAIFGANAVLMFFAITAVFVMTSNGVRDESMLTAGLLFSITGYTSMYFWWTRGTTVWQFSLPILFSTLAFPFMGTTTRSIYTVFVDNNEYLRHNQGTMQALLSMAASVAGFVAPGLVAAFVLRTPEEVTASNDKRELTPYALYAPLFSFVTLLGMVYVNFRKAKEEEAVEEELEVTETDALLRVSKRPSRRRTESYLNIKFDPRTEANRRASITLMGIPQFSFHPSTSTVFEEAELGLQDSDF